MKLYSATLLSVADGAAPPTEFRIFPAGAFSTTKGDFLFDEAAAAAVMAAYQAQGVDCMIDLEHLALGDLARSDASDARGWFKLAMRNGELWAVDCRWTPDGARRLAEKTQRYTSPAFYSDDSGRICELINVALVAMPATHNAPALVAAARRGCAPPKLGHTVGRTPQRSTLQRMNPESVKAALDALEAGDAAKALELLKQLIADAATGGAAGDVAADPGAEAMADTAEPTPPKPGEELAALRRQVEALAKGQSSEIVALRATVKRLEDERNEVELSERRTLIAGLVRLGFETPATAWEGDPKDLKPRKRLIDEPITELRDRVKALSASRPRSFTPPEGSPEAEEWTDAEKKMLAKMNPEQQDKFKAMRLASRTRK